MNSKSSSLRAFALIVTLALEPRMKAGSVE